MQHHYYQSQLLVFSSVGFGLEFPLCVGPLEGFLHVFLGISGIRFLEFFVSLAGYVPEDTPGLFDDFFQVVY